MAMMIMGHSPAFAGWKMTLIGTDRDESVLETARAGVYEEPLMLRVSELQRSRYFDSVPATRQWRLKREVRDMATWKRHDLTEPFDGGPFDLVMLKNVMSLIEPESREGVVRNVLRSLSPGGWLVIGPTEGVHSILG
jgi:chemotaxis protein methyltransferase CheR